MDDRFQSTTLRAKHQHQLCDIIDPIFAGEDASTWLERFRAVGVPCAPINTYSDVLADAQVEYMQWVQPIELPNGFKTKTFASPVRFSGAPSTIQLRPPALGEHNEEIFSGYPER